LVTQLKALEAARRVSGVAPSPAERELESQIRYWPRSANNDPYRAGVEALAQALRALGYPRVVAAYNEFCAPDLEQAANRLIEEGQRSITILSTMLVGGGGHSEDDIPADVERLRGTHPAVSFDYLWPIPASRVAQLYAELLRDHGA
jgi:sirohydrochlorin cobaltochelatase